MRMGGCRPVAEARAGIARSFIGAARRISAGKRLPRVELNAAGRQDVPSRPVMTREQKPACTDLRYIRQGLPSASRRDATPSDSLDISGKTARCADSTRRTRATVDKNGRHPLQYWIPVKIPPRRVDRFGKLIVVESLIDVFSLFESQECVWLS